MKCFFNVVAVALATMALISCNKEQTQNETGLMKSVEVDIANILTTRSSGTAIADGTKVTLNDCQIFFTDGTNLFKGQLADGKEAEHFFSGATVPTSAVRYHFLPSGVNKVVVVGNMGEALTPANLAAIEKDLLIADEQDAANLSLYGESGLTLAGDSDEHTPLYKATVNLVPRVARLEVSGFECTFSETPLYQKIVPTKMVLNNWYGKAKYVATTASEQMNKTITDANVFGWVNPLTGVWYADAISGVELTPAKPAAEPSPVFVYHTFPTTVPQIVVTSLNDDAPTYLVTNGMKTTGDVAVTAFEAGKIYKLAFKFKDTSFNQPQKCIDVTVTVANWQVVPVVPVF